MRAVIVGSSSVTAQRIAEALVSDGARVVGINSSDFEHPALTVNVVADMSDPSQSELAMAAAVDALGGDGIDVLVTAAAKQLGGRLHETSVQTWRAVRAEHPDLSVQFAEAEPPESLTALRSGEVDLAVAFTYDGSDLGRGEDLEGFAVHPLLDEEVRVALPRDHALAGKETVSMTDLTDEDWIAGCARCRGHLLKIAHDAGFAPKVAFETEDYVAVQGFVAAGLGVALIPDLIRAATSNPDVVIRPLDPQSRRRIHVVTTDDLLKVPAVAATLQALIASAQVALPA